MGPRTVGVDTVKHTQSASLRHAFARALQGCRRRGLDSGEGRHRGHHHYIDKGLVADIEGNKVRLSANAAVAVMMEEEK